MHTDGVWCPTAKNHFRGPLRLIIAIFIFFAMLYDGTWHHALNGVWAQHRGEAIPSESPPTVLHHLRGHLSTKQEVQSPVSFSETLSSWNWVMCGIAVFPRGRYQVLLPPFPCLIPQLQQCIKFSSFPSFLVSFRGITVALSHHPIDINCLSQWCCQLLQLLHFCNTGFLSLYTTSLSLLNTGKSYQITVEIDTKLW